MKILIRLIQQGRRHRKSGPLKDFPEAPMNPLRIYLIHTPRFLVYPVFIPYSHPYIHDAPPSYSPACSMQRLIYTTESL